MAVKIICFLLPLLLLTVKLPAQTAGKDSAMLERLKLMRKARLAMDNALQTFHHCVDFEKTKNPSWVNKSANAVTYYRNCEWSGTYIVLNNNSTFKYVYNEEGISEAAAEGIWKKEKHRVILLRFNSKTNKFLSRLLIAKDGDNHQPKGDIRKAFLVTKDKLVPFNLARADSIDKENNSSVARSGKDITKLQVHLSDSSASLTANIRLDHRVFGYETPSTNSARKLLISVFTKDVQDNPFQCPLGAYYETSEMEGMEMRFAGTKNGFVKMRIIRENLPDETVYVLRKWVEFVK